MKNNPRSSDLLEDPVLIRRGVFSTDEAERLLKHPRRKLHAMLFRLVQKGKLIRIKKGLFAIKPAGTRDFKKGYPYNWYLIAQALCARERYFISHYSAMHLHGMTSESIQSVFISRPHQRRIPKGLRIPIYFLTVPETRFWGLEEKWITNEEKVWVSDLERTVIDILDRPELAGGIMEIARSLWLIKEKVNPMKLIRDAERFGSRAVVKRLGFLMELVGIGKAQDLERLRKLIDASRSFAPLDPTIKEGGKYLSAWRLFLNMDPEEIKRNLMT